ncbi:prion-inhibition and propagation domain-containing protein [Sarocladium implicatum]|nr:prion-inhibition and propagation domain-containing protein [Sarocladium implicatum]
MSAVRLIHRLLPFTLSSRSFLCSCCVLINEALITPFVTGMEAAGLAIGAVALASLFSNCLECYQLVNRGMTIDDDYAILATKLGNQELRFLCWGRLFYDGERLIKRYGIPWTQGSGPSRPQVTETSGTDGQSMVPDDKWPLGSFFRRKREQNHTQRPSILDKAQWAITGREKLAELIQHLKDFNDDLEAMTRATDVPTRQRRIVEYEIEELDDIQKLEEIVSATRNNDADLVSEIASLRLEKLTQASARTSIQRGANATDAGSSFFTARSQYTSSPTIIPFTDL